MVWLRTQGFEAPVNTDFQKENDVLIQWKKLEIIQCNNTSFTQHVILMTLSRFSPWLSWLNEGGILFCNGLCVNMQISKITNIIIEMIVTKTSTSGLFELALVS